MRVIKYCGYEISLSEGKPYSVVDFDREMRWGISGKEQEDQMFTPSGLLDYKVFNSGQRLLSIGLNSVEEMFHVCSIFQDHGFKAKPSYHGLDCSQKRFYLDPKTYGLDIGLNLDFHISPGAVPGEYGIYLTLYRKDFKKFLNLVDELREKYNYRTLYVGKNRMTEDIMVIK